MPLYMCSECGSVENTALGGYWATQMEAFERKEKHRPLCSACNPAIGRWHGEFPRRSAAGYVQSKDGFIYSQQEAAERFKHLAPFKPIQLPNAESG